MTDQLEYPKGDADAPTAWDRTDTVPTEAIDEDGRPLTRENEMVEPADSEDLEYSGTDPDDTDPDGDPVPLA